MAAPQRTITWCATMLLGALAVPASGSGAAITRQVFAMGTWLRVDVAGLDRDAALAASERAVRAVAAAEARLSTWRADSELAAVNRAAAPVSVSAALAAELAAALTCATDSGGAFDPTIGPLVAAWDLRGSGRVPDAQQRAAARATVDYRRVRIDGGTLIRPAGTVFEEGAWGKGAGLDAAAQALAALAGVTVTIDLGGQVLRHGAGATTVAVAHPDDRARVAAWVPLARGSLATSGNSERRAGAATHRIGHILDPASGEPAADFGSATVRAATGLAADCWSTAAFVIGPVAGPGRVAAVGDVEALWLWRDGDRLRATATPGWRDEIRLARGVAWAAP